MKSIINKIIIGLVLSCTWTYAQSPVWSEEFNYSGAPDSGVWSYDLGASGWGNSELQNYTDDSANVFVNGSNLVIKALRQGSSFTSARIRTQDKLTFKYGTVEACIQTPDLGNGLWPAFWTLGNSYSNLGWPSCGEIDIMEMGNASAIAGGYVNRRIGSAAHWEHAGSHASYGRYLTMPSGVDGTFVIYRMEWTPTEIKTYVDGNWIWTINISGGAGSDLEEFHEPHFFLLNMAVGGTYTGILSAEGITAPFPAEYKVDWIRIYDNGHTVLGGSSTTEPPAAGTNLLANPGFESGLDSWDLNLSGGSAAVRTSFGREGSGALVINSTYAGGWSSPNLSQRSFAASEGDVFSLRGYMLNSSDDPITGNSFGLFKIEFRDSGGAVLEPASVDVGTSAAFPYYGGESVPRLTVSSATDTWIYSEVLAEAPAGTASVGFFCLNVNEPESPGPMYFDDMSAVLLADPVIPFSLESAVLGASIQISFPTQNGVSYQVDYKASLTNETWIPLESILGNGLTNSALYPATEPVRFFRVSTP